MNSANPSEREIPLAILAGGAGSRMGMPKASLQIRGRPIVEHLLGQFIWPGPTMLVLAPGINPPPGTERVDRVVYDPVAGVGPLRGVLTALDESATEMIVVATVDMPGIGREQLSWIVKQLIDQPELLGVMNARLADDGRRVEPFPSAYRKSAGPIIAEQLTRERRSLHGLLKCAGFVAINVPGDWPVRTWENLNTPEDLKRFAASCGEGTVEGGV